MDTAQATIKARRLRQKAQGHKRAAAAERRAAREAMSELADFLNTCKQMGIVVILEPQPAQPQRRQSGPGSASRECS